MYSRTVCFIALGLAFSSATISHAAEGPASSEFTDRRPIVIRVHNYARVNPRILLQAEGVASAILQQARVDMLWLDCFDGHASAGGAACEFDPSPLVLELNLLPESMSARSPKGSDVYGYAADDGINSIGSDAWIFFDRAADCAREFSLTLPKILGNLIAHELGHLLLRSHAHSQTGLMRARWSRQDVLAASLGDLGFSKQEREMIQRGLAVRRESATHPRAHDSSTP